MPVLSHIFKKGGKSKPTPKAHPPAGASKVKKEQKIPAQKAPATRPKKRIAKEKGGAAIKSATAHSAYNVVVRPHISEKSVAKNNVGKYVFEVADGVSKQQIAKAIEKMYGVKVKNVNKVSVSNRPVRYRRAKGHKRRNNKAVITLEKGQGIEVLPQ